MAGVVIDVQPTIWAYTTTTTVRSTITGTPGSPLYIQYPSATTTKPLSYTKLPESSGVKSYPTPLPILVLTEFNAVIVDSTGSVIETQTIIQSPPPIAPTLPAGYDPGMKVYLVSEAWGWAGWSPAEKAGVCASLTFMVLVITLVSGILWGFIRSRRAYEAKCERELTWRKERSLGVERQKALATVVSR